MVAHDSVSDWRNRTSHLSSIRARCSGILAMAPVHGYPVKLEPLELITDDRVAASARMRVAQVEHMGILALELEIQGVAMPWGYQIMDVICREYLHKS